MQHLIIKCSPLDESFTEKLASTTEELYKNLGDLVLVKDLYNSNFNPVISKEDILGHKDGIYSNEVRHEQELIKWADNLVFIYPLYQLAMPALLKGYIDKVFVQNFAYKYNIDGSIIKLLEGKRASYLLPMGASYEKAKKSGNIDAMNLILKNTIEFRGIKTSAIYYFGPEQRDFTNDELKLKLANIFQQ